ncbi:YabP/YqfC family sporulation protein [Ruminococcus sp. FC2018]|uniref:YabP/YqfC family sporulation protein n=1 Tax=Ruminococcus sp. FC2018 TaxID=1410617 RepID=UPI00048E64B6|nr:YabP/YqfC family sporulation protein [Ruminococcus sp. FC2018]
MKNTKFSFAGKAKDIAYLGSYVTICNNSSVTVENCNQIFECNDIYVKVSAGDYYIEVWGAGLDMATYSGNSVIIEGSIDSVKLINKSFISRREQK